jgi:hypothetical protein
MSTRPQTDSTNFAGTEQVFSVKPWCQNLGISQALYFKECREGRGPYRTNIGRRTIIIKTPAAYARRMMAGAK